MKLLQIESDQLQKAVILDRTSDLMIHEFSNQKWMMDEYMVWYNIL